MDQKERQSPVMQSGDEIYRALSRNGVRLGSPLEADIRARLLDLG